MLRTQYRQNKLCLYQNALTAKVAIGRRSVGYYTTPTQDLFILRRKKTYIYRILPMRKLLWIGTLFPTAFGFIFGNLFGGGGGGCSCQSSCGAPPQPPQLGCLCPPAPNPCQSPAFQPASQQFAPFQMPSFNLQQQPQTSSQNFVPFNPSAVAPQLQQPNSYSYSPSSPPQLPLSQVYPTIPSRAPDFSPAPQFVQPQRQEYQTWPPKRQVQVQPSYSNLIVDNQRYKAGNELGKAADTTQGPVSSNQKFEQSLAQSELSPHPDTDYETKEFIDDVNRVESQAKNGESLDTALLSEYEKYQPTEPPPTSSDARFGGGNPLDESQVDDIHETSITTTVKNVAPNFNDRNEVRTTEVKLTAEKTEVEPYSTNTGGTNDSEWPVSAALPLPTTEVAPRKFNKEAAKVTSEKETTDISQSGYDFSETSTNHNMENSENSMSEAAYIPTRPTYTQQKFESSTTFANSDDGNSDGGESEFGAGYGGPREERAHSDKHLEKAFMKKIKKETQPVLPRNEQQKLLDGHGLTHWKPAQKTRDMRTSSKCNNLKLMQIMHDKMTSSPSVSKQMIYSAASDAFPDRNVDVICSRHSFSYIVVTSPIFCEHRKRPLTCFAFFQP
ncbi:unnamed protein product [Caenorhabditis auriculariae]|uniref:Ground-like domain-containing protein n=1 Tax=Caenorhabditis auriculariae TaxID=2777116 RepID=A0A8S1H0J4_9PELO|nr:unnamed protein product [Caenorhabditis auriculariae]